MFALRLAVSSGKTLPTEGRQHYVHHTSRADWKITSGTRDAKTWATREAAQRNADKWTYDGTITRLDVVEVTDLTTWDYAMHLFIGQAVRNDRGAYREIARKTMWNGQVEILFTDGTTAKCDALTEWEARA